MTFRTEALSLSVYSSTPDFVSKIGLMSRQQALVILHIRLKDRN